MKENEVRVDTYVSDVKVNFSDKDKYLLWSVESHDADFDGAGRATFLLQINEVQISDDLWNPYTQLTDNFSYLTIKQSDF